MTEPTDRFRDYYCLPSVSYVSAARCGWYKDLSHSIFYYHSPTRSGEMSRDPVYKKQGLNGCITQLSRLILIHEKLVHKYIISVAEDAIDRAEQDIASIEGKQTQPKFKHIDSVGVHLAESVAATALIKHAEEQAAELENIRDDMQNTATYEFLSGPDAVSYSCDKEKELVSKCRTYGRVLLNELLDANWEKAMTYKEEEAVLKNYLETDGDESIFIRTALE
jgi:hypothetical protein